MIESTSIQSKQNQPYGDFFRIWEIITDDNTMAEVLDYCQTELSKSNPPLPSEQEYMSAIRYPNGAEQGNADYYFRGYYKLNKLDEKRYRYTIAEPYAD